MRRTLIVLTLSLAACSDWPQAGGEQFARSTGPWPDLVPLNDALNVAPSAEGQAVDQLSARAAALRARARILRQSATTRDEMEALRARLPR